MYKIDLDCHRKVFHHVPYPLPPVLAYSIRFDIMALILGEFLVMCGGFFVVFFVLITCIDVGLKNETRSERAIRRRNRYR